MSRPLRASTYRSYILRVWRDDTRKPWSVTLQAVRDETTHHFVDLDAMLTHLQAELVELGAARAAAQAPDHRLDE